MKMIYRDFDEEREYGVAILDIIVFGSIVVGTFASRISSLLIDKLQLICPNDIDTRMRDESIALGTLSLVHTFFFSRIYFFSQRISLYNRTEQRGKSRGRQ